MPPQATQAPREWKKVPFFTKRQQELSYWRAEGPQQLLVEEKLLRLVLSGRRTPWCCPPLSLSSSAAPSVFASSFPLPLCINALSDLEKVCF